MATFTRSPISAVLTDERGYKVDTTNPLPVDPAESGAPNFSPAQVSVTSSATALLASTRSTRRAALITNTDSSNTVYIGASNSVTSSTGHPLPAGQSMTLPYTGTVYAITASATVTVGVSEIYD